MYQHRHPFFSAGAALLLLVAAACSQKELNDVRLSTNKGYTDKPIKTFKAMDANGEWVDAEIDEGDRNISFVFRTHSTLEKVNCMIEVDPEWATLIYPEQRDFVLNLNASQTITVNDGVDDIRYRVSGSILEPLKGLSAKVGGETVRAASISTEMTLRFRETTSRSAFKKVQLDAELDDGCVLLYPEDLSEVDLNGAPVTLKVYDKNAHFEKTYTVYAVPGAAINVNAGGWEDVSLPWAAAHSVDLPDHVSIYKTASLHGTSGRIGWVVVVQGGQVEGKLMAKADFPTAAQSKVSAALHDNPGYTLFVPYQGPQMWRTTANGDNTYISPVIWRNGAFARSLNFGTLPAVGVKDGKAEIRYAYNIGDKLYSFDRPYAEPAAENGEPWDVDFAAGGCFMLVQGGSNLIGGSDDRSTSAYRQNYLPYPDTYSFITPNWSTYQPFTTYMNQRGGRTAIGATADGSLVVFQTEMLVNSHNQYQWTSTADSGSTMNEVARELADMGCTSAALWEENYWNVILVQDGGAYNEGSLYGAEFFHHARRHYLDASGHNPGDLANSEYENLYVLMIK